MRDRLLAKGVYVVMEEGGRTKKACEERAGKRGEGEG